MWNQDPREKGMGVSAGGANESWNWDGIDGDVLF